MFDIGFGELILVFVIGLIVLGPQRLPVAVKTVVGWLRAMRSLASSVQNELAQELKLQELQDSVRKVEKASIGNLSPELKASMDELRDAAESMRRTYSPEDAEKASDEAQTIHRPVQPASPTPPSEETARESINKITQANARDLAAQLADVPQPEVLTQTKPGPRAAQPMASAPTANERS